MRRPPARRRRPSFHLRSTDGHVAHPLTGLYADVLRTIISSSVQRVHRRRPHPRPSRRAASSSVMGTAGDIEQLAPDPSEISRPTVSSSTVPKLLLASTLVLQPQRDLAGYGNTVSVRPSGVPSPFLQFDCLVQTKCAAVDEIRVQHVEYSVGGQHIVDAAGRIEPERLALTQVQQAGRMIHIAIGQHRGANWTVTQAALRGRGPPRLLAQVRGGVEKRVSACHRRKNGDGDCVCASPVTRPARKPCSCCSCSSTAETAARRRAEYPDLHVSPPSGIRAGNIPCPGVAGKAPHAWAGD